MDKNRHRVQRLTLDEETFARRTPEIEHERAVAIFDLLQRNYFHPADCDSGPYGLVLSLEESRLVFDIRSMDEAPLARVALPLAPLRQVIKDYFLVCESYYAAIKTAPPSQIETLDMGRRSLHNEGSELLRAALKSKINMDLDTARRLFTLLCVLHIRG